MIKLFTKRENWSLNAVLWGSLIAVFVFSPVFAQAQTASQLQIQIQQLLAQVQQLQARLSGNTFVSYSYARDLTIGSRGADVAALQDFLIVQNKGTASAQLASTFASGVVKGYFGVQTRAALAEWQLAMGISPAVGYFGPITRTRIAAMVVILPPVVDTDDDDDNDDNDDLEGGAGSLADADYVSKLSNEEVGEGEEDAEVAGLEIEADDNSDIEITAVSLNFSPGTATRDFDRYADEVSISLDGEEFARLDADEFADDDNFDKTVSLDRGAIIRGGEVGDLVVSVSGISNLDSDDEGDTWTLEFESVRFRDGQGAVITESATGDINDGTGRTFSFEGFASASDLELRVSGGNDEINDAQTVQVSDSDDTEGVEILSFEIEVEGDSDVSVDDLVINLDSVGAGVGEIINTVELIVDGDTVGSEAVSSSVATDRDITFDNLDWTIDAGDTVEVIVSVDVNELGGNFTEGDSLSANVNPDNWNVEDEQGDDISTNDKGGTASSESHTFFGQGINIESVSTSQSVRDTNGDTAGGEEATFTVRFEVAAFDEDIYIPLGATTATSSVDTDDGVAYTIENSDGDEIMLGGIDGSTNAVVSSTANTSGSYYIVRDGETESFTLTVTLAPNNDGYYRLQLYGVNYNVGAEAAADTMQRAIPAVDFETDYANINV